MPFVKPILLKSDRVINMQIMQQSTTCACYIKVTVRMILLATHITVLTLYKQIQNEMTYSYVDCLLINVLQVIEKQVFMNT